MFNGSNKVIDKKIKKLETRVTDLMNEREETERQTKELLDIIHFTENISAKIHGLIDENEIYRTINDELKKSSNYKLGIYKLTEDERYLENKIIKNWIPEIEVKGLENVVGIKEKTLLIEINKSKIYTDLLKEGKTTFFKSGDILKDIFPRSISTVIYKVAGSEKVNTVLTPLNLYGQNSGALIIGSYDLTESFIPIAISLSRHISQTLESAKEYKERKEAEERLKKSELKYRDLVMVNPGIIYRLDYKRRLTYISPEVENLLGYTPEELHGKDISVIVLPEDLEKIKDMASLRTGPRRTKKLELRLKKKGNWPVHVAINWVEINATGVYEDGWVGDGKIESRGQSKGKFLGTQGTILDISPRKKTEEELKSAHDLMEAIFNNLDEMLFSVDTKNHKLLMISEACKELTGYEKEEFYKDNQLWFKLTHPEDKIIIDAGYPKMFRGELVRDEYRIIRKDGQIKWVDSKIKPRLDEDGNLVYFDGFVTDITDRKKMEKILQEREYRFRELFNNMSSGVAIYRAVENGSDFEFVDFNKASEKIEKITKEEVMGKFVTEVFPGIKDFGLFDVFQRVYKTGRAEHHPVCIYEDKRISGWRENYVYKLTSEEIVAIYDDVTDQKKAEEALIKSEEKFREIFSNSLDTIFTTTPDGKLADINSSGLKLFGYTQDEIKKINLKDLYVDHRERSNCQNKMQKNGFIRNCEVKLRAKNGQILDCIISAIAQNDENGKATGYHGIIHDMTDLKILGGLLPICSHCKKIRDDKGYWNQVENYIDQHSRAFFSHSICPECLKKHYPEVLDKLNKG